MLQSLAFVQGFHLAMNVLGISSCLGPQTSSLSLTGVRVYLTEPEKHYEMLEAEAKAKQEAPELIESLTRRVDLSAPLRTHTSRSRPPWTGGLVSGLEDASRGRVLA